MTHVHQMKVCSCGTVISQCKCPDSGKRRIIVSQGCAVCQETIVEQASTIQIDERVDAMRIDDV